MGNELVVHTLHRFANLRRCYGYLLLFEACLLSLDTFVESTFLHVFHHQVDVLNIVEEAVKFDDVGMIEEHLKLDFQDNLMAHLQTLYHLLRHLFDCVDCPSQLVSRQMHLTESPRSNFLPKLKIFKLKARH